MTGELVLVTGGSGFLATHCILELLRSGSRVRTTVRSLTREAQVRAAVTRGGLDPGDRLEFASADLLADDGWAEAARGCAFVQHVASPLPIRQPRNADDLVRPARDGALRVLRAARDAGVRRVVMTSSFAAIGYGHRGPTGVLDERFWTDPDGPGVTAYTRSKTLAERAAWEFVDREGGGLELVALNPVVILGPALGADYSASIELVRMMLARAMPLLPRIGVGIVDVRDVAMLHRLAMVTPEAAGERYLLVSGRLLMLKEIALALRKGLGSDASRVPTREVPDWVIRTAGLFVPAAHDAASQLGRRTEASAAKAERTFGWTPIGAEDAAIAAGRSLIDLGVVKR